MISPLGLIKGLIYFSAKEITLKLLDQIQQVCKNHSADHYLSTPQAIENLVFATVQAYTPPT